MLAMVMPAHFAYFCASPIMTKLGDAIHLHIILHHISAEGDHVDGVQADAVGIKEGHDLDGRDLCVEGLGVFEIIVPDLINNITKKFCNATFGRCKLA